MKTKIVLVTPELAEKYLEKNKNNRRLSMHTAKAYAQDMIIGKWLSNGEPLVFDENGFLRNGQHRCKAIIICGIPQEMLVVYDVPEESCAIFDRGRPRSALDTLRIRSEIDPYLCDSSIIAAIKLLMYEEKGINKLSDFEIIEFINQNEEALIKARKLVCGKKKMGVNLRNGTFVAAFFVAIQNNISYEDLQIFAEILNSGIPNEPWQTAPIILRNDFISGKLPYQSGNTERVNCMHATHKAILDFEDRYRRKKSYKNETNKIFKSFKED